MPPKKVVRKSVAAGAGEPQANGPLARPVGREAHESPLQSEAGRPFVDLFPPNRIRY
jgi:hypothetical protein